MLKKHTVLVILRPAEKPGTWMTRDHGVVDMNTMVNVEGGAEVETDSGKLFLPGASVLGDTVTLTADHDQVN